MNILLIATIVLLIARLGIFAFLHVKYRELSVFTNTVSDYGTGKSRNMYTIMGALSLVAYVALFAFLVINGSNPSWLTYILGLAVAGSIAILFFPTDRTGEKSTRTGRIHWGLAILNFATLFVFMTNAQIVSVSQNDVLSAMTWIVRITFYAFLASLVLPKLRQNYIGLTERLFLVATPLWFIVFALLMLNYQM